MVRIGLTGGIASGKSTIADMFARHGAEIIDTDDIARELVAPGTPALAAIVEAFGSAVLTGAGDLDRRRMRSLVFSDPERRKRLEDILHPMIRREALVRSSSSRAPYVILIVPLLFETGFDALVDRTLVVDCPQAMQLERLMARDGVSRAEAQAAIDAQMSRNERCARADDSIDSSTDLPTTEKRVAELHRRYLDMAKN